MNGTCYNCNNETMDPIGHGRKCISLGDNECLVLAGSDDFWLLLRCSLNIRMINIDKFLRKIWLECCNHSSRFNCQKNNTLLDLINNENLEIDYTYDLEVPTDVQILVLKFNTINNIQQNKESSIQIVGQNSFPTHKCDIKKCTNTAAYIGNNQIICEPCKSKRKRTKKILPIVNSPRLGECDYNGTFIPGNLQLYTEIFDSTIVDNNGTDEESKYNFNRDDDPYGECLKCNSIHKRSYMISHLRKTCAANSVIVNIVLSDSIEYVYEYQWQLFECPHTITMGQFKEFFKEHGGFDTLETKVRDSTKLIDLVSTSRDIAFTFRKGDSDDDSNSDRSFFASVHCKKETCNNTNSVKLIARSKKIQKIIYSTIDPHQVQQ